jgi:hypothetical protein
MLILQRPGIARPFGTRDFGAELRKIGNTVFLENAFEILLNLGSGRKYPRPFGVGLERIGIGVRWHIASQAWISIIPPGSPQCPGLFQNNEFLPAILQVNTSQNAGHSATNHYDIIFHWNSLNINYFCCRESAIHRKIDPGNK